jgi:hypothetical protein
MATSRWAAILCKFADDSTATLPLAHYQRLFTGVGTGSFNMVDFFRDMSHQQVDTSASEIFGWFTLSINRSAYAGNVPTPPAGQVNRNGLVAACRQAATNGGVDLGSFDGVVVSMNGGVDLFGYVGGMEAFCDSNSLSPSPLGQEMGHGYGLDHARRDGSDADYQDPWDVMSVYDGCFMQPSAEWGTVGPALNAWCMRSQGWLNESRVWTSSTPGFDSTINLRPLHRLDLAGFLAADLANFLVEYRAKDRWDAAFPRSAVFVHRFEDNHSYVMPGTGGNYDLAAGDVFEIGNAASPFSTYSRVEVLSIDDSSQTATIRLHQKARVPFPFEELVARIIGGVASDGPGGAFIGGQFHPIPPRGPESVILQQLVNYMAVRGIQDVSVRAKAQGAALAAMSKAITARMSQLEPLRSPAPLKGNTGQ